jgi:hypothetical protein
MGRRVTVSHVSRRAVSSPPAAARARLTGKRRKEKEKERNWQICKRDSGFFEN